MPEEERPLQQQQRSRDIQIMHSNDETVETKLQRCYVPLYMSHFVSTYLRWDKQKNPTLLRG